MAQCMGFMAGGSQHYRSTWESASTLHSFHLYVILLKNMKEKLDTAAVRPIEKSLQHLPFRHTANSEVPHIWEKKKCAVTGEI